MTPQITPDSSVNQVRQRLGNRYTIERELGRGGMGVVYLARDVQLDRLVALKVLPQEFAVQPVLRDRFLRETKMAAGFSHPNIVPVYAVEETPDLLAYAMGYVEGESLVERVRRAGPLPVREIVRLMQDVGYALAYAHGHGVVHRDIKPDNIMLERASGRALVMDFGIARTLSAKPTMNAGLTRVGEVVGTPEYMSPEQASGDEVDGRSDLYSLGLTVFFAATGTTAISGESTQKVLVKQLTETLPPIGSLRKDLPEALAQAVDLTVKKDPADRFESAAALVDALDVAQLAAPEIPLPIRLFAQEAGTLLTIAIGVSLAIFFLLQEHSNRSGDMMLLSVLLATIVITRVLQTFSEARRLAVSGFTTDDVMLGLARVMDERAGRRTELRADPATVRARHITVGWAVGLLIGAAAALRGGFYFRHQTGPDSYHVDLPGVVLIFICIFMLGSGLVLLFKSPLRMPIGERLFRWIWLGIPGRTFVNLAGRKTRRVGAPVVHTFSRGSVSSTSGAKNPIATSFSTPRAVSSAAPVARDAAPVSADRMEALEARVTRLEARGSNT